MNILHIITGLADGGAEGVLFRLCVHDRQNCHTVISLTDRGKYGDRLERAGVSVYCLQMPRGRLRLSALWRLWSLVRTLRPDIVQTWMYHANILGGVIARLAGNHAVFWGIRHSDFQPGTTRWSTVVIARLGAILSRWIPAGIVFCSVNASELHKALGYDGKKVTVIPNGYDCAEFSPDSAARSAMRTACWGGGHAIPVIGMVARFNPQKDHRTLLQALMILSKRSCPFRCVLVGTGMDRHQEALMHAIREAGIEHQVMLLGQRDDIPAVMNALDLHVLSSVGGEAFPNVVAEAMACATPCVVTDVGDAAEIVGDTGWVVPPANPEQLATALAGALQEMQDRFAWEQRRQAARQRIVGRFLLETMVRAYRDLWMGHNV
ncbi:glycosyl transferase group 1 [Desulfobulbus propionicus DSM 2032]|uniref:Glycosyl transferase group 1 n=1 Tax=Desulfobulbus propionicus (strain ATCC 33891 / DSM 2032 / VKM B-1956 / 1pr3) TaxID=577650 RepID=A0A7U3YPT0_DESPD|nr:glycosyltransferase [Desulfobulbus propionicus]ADW19315.1 glycosyl transferase group 1 [Desulfobulbus propionicus DSM 2032]